MFLYHNAMTFDNKRHDNLGIGPVGASMAVLQVASDNTFPHEVPM